MTPGNLGTRGGSAGAFLRRQQRDWGVTVVRTSLDRLAYQMVFPYLSVYIVALGATATQLGLVSSLGMAVAGLAGPFIGWLIDRHGPRTFYLVGIGFLVVAYLTYALANSWPVTIPGDDGLLARLLHQRPQLRNDLRQLPGQPGSGDRDDDLRDRRRGDARDHRPDHWRPDRFVLRDHRPGRDPAPLPVRLRRQRRHLRDRVHAAVAPAVGERPQRRQPFGCAAATFAR